MFAHEPLTALIEAVAEWSDGVLHGHHELPMAYPGGVDVVYDTISRKESLEVACRVLKARGTIVKAGVHGPTKWEWTPLYFKEIAWVGSNAFGIETVDGVRRHGIAHYLDLVERVGSISRRCSRTSSRSTNGATRSACSPIRNRPARSKSHCDPDPARRTAVRGRGR